MGVSIQWGGAGDGDTRRDQGVYHLSQEHGLTINYDLSYHGIVSGGGAEDRDAALGDTMVGDRYRYIRYKSGKQVSGYGGGVLGQRIWSERD